MKKVMFALCFVFGGIAVVCAQDPDTTSYQYRTDESPYEQDAQTQNQYQQDRQRIQSTELPDQVKRTLEGEEYRGWMVSGAFKATAQLEDAQNGMNGQDNTTPDVNGQPGIGATDQEEEDIYIVELRNGAETQTLIFDKDGNKLESQEEMGTEYNQYNQQNDQYNQQNDQYNQQNDQYNPNDQSDQSSQYNQNDRESQYNDNTNQQNQYNEGMEEQQSDQWNDNATEQTEQSEDWSRESSRQPSQSDFDQSINSELDQSSEPSLDQSTESQGAQSPGSTGQSPATEQR